MDLAIYRHRRLVWAGILGEIMFGSDFFKWFQFIIELTRLIGKIFGNGEDETGLQDALDGANGKKKKPADASG